MTRPTFPSRNPWGIPDLPHAPLAATPGFLIPWGTRLRGEEPAGAWHFFLDDARFGALWGQPRRTLSRVARCGAALTPDWSLYRDAPLAEQLRAVYQSRWVGAWWASQGLVVIPTISWSSEPSWDFAFLGLPTRSVVAVGTVGVRLADPVERGLFVAGYREMVRRLAPSRILVYGEGLPEPLAALAETWGYPSRWRSIRRARAEGGRPWEPAWASGGLPTVEVEPLPGEVRAVRGER